ncbi:MAG: LapA family protein [Prochloron sp. SP5CPC1]|nr:LapA family protein [Candidatus Paraprochloron terpiosi SP5CPC1]
MHVKVRLLILVLLLGTAIALFLQNRQPISLVFFNSTPVTLPLAIWVFLFTAAGALTSACLTYLNYIAVAGIDPKATESDPPSFELPEPPREYRTENMKREDEWNIEEPPAEPTNLREDYHDTEEEYNYERDSSDSTYSYSYREDSQRNLYGVQSETSSREEVYDANYRVITPPYRQKQPQEEEDPDEEDWI